MSGSLDTRHPPRTKLGFDNGDSNIIDHLPLESLGSSKPGSPFLKPNDFWVRAASPGSDYGQPSPCPSRALSPAPYGPHYPQTRRAAMHQSLNRFWLRNRGVVLVGVSQLFGALMNLAARMLETRGMHPLQILLLRMSSTTAMSCLYMWWMSVPDFPFGPRGVRWALVIRGFTGFFGIYGMWYSMMYLPLAEATVITFLAPMLSGYICDILLKDPFTRREQLASLIALAGVVLIARPASLFGSSPAPSSHPPQPMLNSTTTITALPRSEPGDEPTPTQRLGAILVALLGVLGAACAFSAIRYIGKRAHPLITVTYFSVWSTLVSGTALLLAPALGIGQEGPRTIGFAGLLPSSAYEWFLLASLGLCGFVMQSMMTAGIGGEKSNRATAMSYTHMLFAAGFDRWVFGHQMGVVSVLGCGLILGSALWAALGKKEGAAGRKQEGDVEMDGGRCGIGMGEEGVPMLDNQGADCEEETEEDPSSVGHR